MKPYLRVIFYTILILFYYGCKNPSSNKISENEFTDSTDITKLQSQFLSGSHLCREPMPPMDELIVRSDLTDGKAQIICIAAVVNESDAESEMELEIELSNGGDITKKSEKLLCKPNDTTKLTIALTLDHPKLWSPESPSLYEVKGKLKKDEAVIDEVADHTGIRKISIQGNTILLNDNPVTIKGVNRYDDYGNSGVNVPEDTLRNYLEHVQ